MKIYDIRGITNYNTEYFIGSIPDNFTPKYSAFTMCFGSNSEDKWYMITVYPKNAIAQYPNQSIISLRKVINYPYEGPDNVRGQMIWIV